MNLVTVQFDSKTNLPCGINNIKDVIVNKTDFLFLERNGAKIIKWTRCQESCQAYDLTRRYACLCFDWCENCYWALPECEQYIIYRLDLQFTEVGSLNFNYSSSQRPIGINCVDSGEIIVSFPCQDVSINKTNQNVTIVESKNSCKNANIVAMCQSCTARAYVEGCRQIIAFSSKCDCEVVEIALQRQSRILGMTACCCVDNENSCRIYAVVFNSCTQENSIFQYCVTYKNQSEDFYCFEPCNGKSCKQKCCGEKCGRYEIMHSIALEEAGIAHILNAEGEKIQKAVALSNDVGELICLNESVKHTLTQITLLEGQLYSKLETLVKNCEFDECENHCPTVPPIPCPCKKDVKEIEE